MEQRTIKSGASVVCVFMYMEGERGGKKIHFLAVLSSFNGYLIKWDAWADLPKFTAVMRLITVFFLIMSYCLWQPVNRAV